MQTNAGKQLEAIVKDLLPHTAPLMQQLTLLSHVRGLTQQIKREAVAQPQGK